MSCRARHSDQYARQDPAARRCHGFRRLARSGSHRPRFAQFEGPPFNFGNYRDCLPLLLLGDVTEADADCIDAVEARREQALENQVWNGRRGYSGQSNDEGVAERAALSSPDSPHPWDSPFGPAFAVCDRSHRSQSGSSPNSGRRNSANVVRHWGRMTGKAWTSCLEQARMNRARAACDNGRVMAFALNKVRQG